MTVDYSTEYKIPYERRRIEPVTERSYSPVTTYKLTDSGQEKYGKGIPLDKMVIDTDYYVVKDRLHEPNKTRSAKGWNQT